MNIQRIALVGGSGFVGRHLARHLHNRGYMCRIVSRRPHRLHEMGSIVEGVAADPFDRTQLTAAFGGCDAVINLVGILNSGGKQRSFRRVHVDLVENLVAAAHDAGVTRLLHMSALNADQSSGSSQYLRTKGEGENRAHTLGRPSIAVTSLRPSVIFGPDDGFLNRFATLLKIPGPMPLACPDAVLAPVYIGDVVCAFGNALEDRTTFGRRYDLCGPHSYTLRQLVEFIAAHTGHHKWIVGMPDWASRLQAAVLQYAPGKPFTPDNYQSLRTPSVCKQDGLAALGVEATSLENAGARILCGEGHLARLSRLRRLNQR
ncbi:MAG: complex I NDUFA9 subunit family protein [Chromatiaceae bacterium]|nr:complex I NDUFA9 subunit family protein [Gammaproteobacteria bacterium]MCP5300000.1 complex I NDUFA9 subunit family protein [Chromatiaceae bacterium]MCP5422072.1 complex I NDUFA9 subunit family protein [Chromatiaceae bacterium]